MNLADAMVARMLPMATDLVIRVHDREPDGIAELVEPMGIQELRTLVVVLAAMVPTDARIGDLLAWVDDPSHLDLKRCCLCGEDKPRVAFTVERRKPDGRRPSCRSCDAAARRETSREVAA